jgi:hypothetical protein
MNTIHKLLELMTVRNPGRLTWLINAGILECVYLLRCFFRPEFNNPAVLRHSNDELIFDINAMPECRHQKVVQRQFTDADFNLTLSRLLIFHWYLSVYDCDFEDGESGDTCTQIHLGITDNTTRKTEGCFSSLITEFVWRGRSPNCALDAALPQ